MSVNPVTGIVTYTLAEWKEESQLWERDGALRERERIVQVIEGSEFVCRGHNGKDCPDVMTCTFVADRREWLLKRQYLFEDVSERLSWVWHGQLCDADTDDGQMFPFENCTKLIALIKGCNK